MIPFIMSTSSGLAARASAFLWELSMVQHTRQQRHPQHLRMHTGNVSDCYFAGCRSLGRALAEGQARVVAACWGSSLAVLSAALDKAELELASYGCFERERERD